MILNKEDLNEIYSILNTLETQKDYLQYNIDKIKKILEEQNKGDK